MAKIDLNFKIKNLDGVEVTPASDSHEVNAGKIIANNLVSTPGKNGSVLKFYDWAIKLNTGKALELDRTDTAELRKFVEDHPQLSILIKAQVLEKFGK